MIKKINGQEALLTKNAAEASNIRETTQADAPELKLSYFEQRMLELGYDPEKDDSWYESHPDEPYCKKTKHPLFWEDAKNGDICIGYLNLDGGLMTYDASTSKSRQNITPYFRRRLAAPLKETKYLPCKVGFGTSVYLTKPVQESFQAQNKIDKLIIVEGEFKAFVGAKKGLFIVGIPGIGIWKHKEDTTIFPVIKKICEICQVKDIVFLTDADTMQVRYKEDKDLYVRPHHFFCAVEKFKALTNELNVNQYFMYIQEHSPYKGLDDLLNAHADSANLIVDEILGKSKFKCARFFHTYHISNYSFSKIKKLFHIENVKSFYERYEAEIGTQDFIFNHGKYVYDMAKNDLITLHNGLAHGMFMLSGKVYKKGLQPMNDGTQETVIAEIPRAQLKAQFKTNKLVDELISCMPLYDGVVNIPSHGSKYVEEVVTNDRDGCKLIWKNLYNNVSWEEAEGSFETTLKIIKHIFGTGQILYKGTTIDEWELGLDYLQLLWSNPTQKLPILTCVSKERNTGKSTLFDYMRVLFQQNTKQVREQDFMSEFSSYMATSLLLVAEEFTLKNMPLLQKLKNMVTSPKMPYRAMHKNTTEVDSFIHVGITSNSLEDFTCLDDDEVRFWIREIPVLQKGELDLDILKKAVAEIPAFIYFLNRRQMVTQRDSRAWFDFQIIKTDALKKVLDLSKTEIQKEIEYYLRETFSQINVPILKYSTKDIQSEIRSVKYTTIQIRDCLTLKMKVEDSKWSNPYTVLKWDETAASIQTSFKKSIFYKFYFSDYFEIQEVVELLKGHHLVELEEELKKANKKAIYPLVTANMLAKQEQIKQAMQKKNVTLEKIEFLRQSLTSFAELFAQIA
jgi:hypothetical protein